MPGGTSRDDGFSLIEVLVSIALVGVVLTAVTSFFIRTVSATGQQRGKQIAAHLADTAMERVRALKGSSITEGRIEATATNPLPAAAALLANTIEWNQPAVNATPLLPLELPLDTVAGTVYRTRFYVGKCALPAHTTEGALTAGVDHCTGAGAAAADAIGLFRVVAAVTWNDKNCTDALCVFATSTLVSMKSDEPIFNLNDTAPDPIIENPTKRTSRKIDPIDTQTVLDDVIGAYGGVAPLKMKGTNIPPGLTLAENGRISGTPTTAGKFTVKLTVTDARARSDTVEFVWTVLSTPKLAPPGNQITPVGATVHLPIVNNGPGEGILTWKLTGTPPAGITFDPATGVFAGVPTTAAPAVPLTVRLTDANQKFSEVQFTWTVNPAAPAKPSQTVTG
jgi:prepilin-type N-terminal cleavage/methylation domain-containing protein